MAPATQVLYDDDPKAAAKLLQSRADYLSLTTGQHTPGSSVALRHPVCWDRYIMMSYFSALPPTPVLFLHERSTKRGTRRLVCVTFEGWVGGDLPFLGERSFEPVSLLGGHRSGLGVFPWFIGDAAELSGLAKAGGAVTVQKIRFYAGQFDPSDQSHFTVEFENDGKKGIIDGWLLDDPSAKEGVKVKLAVRNAPATGKAD
jgi:hypothetical protein